MVYFYDGDGGEVNTELQPLDEGSKIERATHYSKKKEVY
jgi:hypothetical protein